MKSAKTLYKVLSEWESGKEEIRYSLKIPKSSKRFHSDVISQIVSCIFIFAVLMFSGDFSFSSSLIMVVALFTFFSFAWGWKYNTYFFIINRKTHKIRYWSISNSAYGASKYHEYIVLPAFLLPETSNQHEIDEYIKIRKTLQQKISTETGWTFKENYQTESRHELFK